MVVKHHLDYNNCFLCSFVHNMMLLHAWIHTLKLPAAYIFSVFFDVLFPCIMLETHQACLQIHACCVNFHVLHNCIFCIICIWSLFPISWERATHCTSHALLSP
ncbi:unnamed protein product [Cuscuta epithymum]|uniref:Uncharacterized protein n=1 Tax=Cuscuta epithymum TaxID=186058 RepID=A0AAV0EPI3_9ASTE|nr:unnamed protein product [Cuscuta epithymum]